MSRHASFVTAAQSERPSSADKSTNFPDVTHQIKCPGSTDAAAKDGVLFNVTQSSSHGRDRSAALRIVATDDRHLTSARLSEVLRSIAVTATIDDNSTEQAEADDPVAAGERVYFCHVKLVTFEGGEIAIKSFVVKT